jgi:PAS domain S-box-containing protein
MFRVLQIDDEPVFFDIMRTFLENDFVIEPVNSGQVALEKLAKGGFDAIVSDYQMPNMDGLQLLKRVRERDTAIPFILFTGRGREEVAMEALNNGATFYVHKSTDAAPQYTELAHKLRLAIERRRAQDDLIESMRKLAQAQHIAHVGSWTIKLADGKVDWSNEMYRIFGLLPSVFKPTDERIISMIHPEDRKLFGEVRDRMMVEGRPVSARFRFLLPNGEIRYAKAQMELVYGLEHRPIEISGVTTDITELVRAEEALQESEALWKFALEVSEEGVYDWNIRSGRVYCSDHYMALLGQEPLSAMSTRTEWEKAIHPHDRPSVINALDCHIGGQSAVFNAEYRRSCAGDNYKWVLDRGKVVSRTANGEPLRYVGVLVDASNHHKAGIERRKGLSSYSDLANSFEDGIIIEDKGLVIFINTVGLELLGYDDARDILGREVCDLVDPDHVDNVRSTLLAGYSAPREVDLLCNSGTTIHVKITTVPFTRRGHIAHQLLFVKAT